MNAEPSRELPVIRLAHLYWARGERARAESMFRDYERTALTLIADGQSRGSVLYQLALIHALRGETEHAVARLEEALHAGTRGEDFRIAPLPATFLADPRVLRIRDEAFAVHERQRQRALQEARE